MLNGIASAIPATLVLFFITDVLQRGSAAGHVSRALFHRGGGGHAAVGASLSARFGKVRAWHAAMLIGRRGVRLGGAARQRRRRRVRRDLRGVGPGARRRPRAAAVAARRRDRTRRHVCSATGAYFGLWTLATKLNLALAAGIALPLLGLLGYAPGSRGSVRADARWRSSTPACRASLKIGAAFALASVRSRNGDTAASDH